MEFIGFCVACYLIWKAIDGLSNKNSAEVQITRTTIVTDGPKGRSITTETHEKYTGYQENRTLGRPAPPASPSLPNRSSARIIDVTENHNCITDDRPRDWYSSQVQRQAIAASQPPAIEHERTSQCSSCGKTKPISDFYNSRTGGTTAWCKQCHADSKQSQPGENRHYKICPKRKSRRLRTNYGKSDKNPDGLTKWCLPCLKKTR